LGIQRANLAEFSGLKASTVSSFGKKSTETGFFEAVASQVAAKVRILV
jgi:hypothetical protein